jgi:hypothetical protein
MTITPLQGGLILPVSLKLEPPKGAVVQSYQILPFTVPNGSTWILDPAIGKQLQALDVIQSIAIDNRNGCLDVYLSDQTGQINILCQAGNWGIYPVLMQQPIFTISMLYNNAANSGAGWAFPVLTAADVDVPVTYISLCNAYIDSIQYTNQKKNFMVKGGYATALTGSSGGFTDPSGSLRVGGQFNSIDVDYNFLGTTVWAGYLQISDTSTGATIVAFPASYNGVSQSGSVYKTYETRGYIRATDATQLNMYPTIGTNTINIAHRLFMR